MPAKAGAPRTYGPPRGATGDTRRDDVAVRRTTGWIALCTVALVPGSSATDATPLAPPPSPLHGPGAHSSPSGPSSPLGAGRAHGADRPSPTTHSYGQRPDQQITVHPAHGHERAGPAPAIVLLHGGYWAYRATWSSLPHTLAEQGFVVLDVGYTLSPTAHWPAQYDDVHHALDWSAAHADEFGFNPDRMLVLGSSAGGHLAALLGTHPTGREQLRGVIALSPVVSPYQAWVDGGSASASLRQQRLRVAAEELVGCVPDRQDPRCWKRWQSTVVKRHANDASAPMLLVHSAGDYVSEGPSRELAEVLPRTTVAVVPGAGHGRGLLAVPGVGRELVAWARKALR